MYVVEIIDISVWFFHCDCESICDIFLLIFPCSAAFYAHSSISVGDISLTNVVLIYWYILWILESFAASIYRLKIQKPIFSFSSLIFLKSTSFTATFKYRMYVLQWEWLNKSNQREKKEKGVYLVRLQKERIGELIISLTTMYQLWYNSNDFETFSSVIPHNCFNLNDTKKKPISHVIEC